MMTQKRFSRKLFALRKELTSFNERPRNLPAYLCKGPLIASVLLLFLIPINPNTLNAQTVLFRTGFGGSTYIDTIEYEDITGLDDNVIAPNDWDTDLPNYLAHIGEWNFKYELKDSNTVDHMIAELVPGPVDTNNQVLRYTIIHDSGYPDIGKNGETGRVQAQINHGSDFIFDSINYQNGLRHFNYTTDLFIPQDFEWMLKAGLNREYNFMTLSEFFNSKQAGTFDDQSFRIGLELVKDSMDNHFRFALEGDPRTFPDPDNDPDGQWGGDDSWFFLSDGAESGTGDVTVGATEDTLASLNLNKWMTLDVTMVEGDEDNGRFILKITQEGNTYTVFDLTINTHHESDTLLDGFHFIQPLKLYTRARVIDWCIEDDSLYCDNLDTIGGFKQNHYIEDLDIMNTEHQAVCHVFWDNFTLRKVSVDDSPTPCGGIKAGNRDAAQEDDTMMVDSTGLRLGKHQIGLIFDGYDIPLGATIDSAFVQFKMRAGSTQSDTVIVNIKGSLDTTFFDADPDIAARIDAGIGDIPDWDIKTWNPGEEGINQRTPELKDIIQELLDGNNESGGINPADKINILFDVDANGKRRTAWSWENNNPNNVAKLCIYYTYTESKIEGTLEYNCQAVQYVPDISVVIQPVTEDPCLKGTTNETLDQNGDYESDLCSEVAEYHIQPQKTNHKLCGVNVHDAVQVSNHISNIDSSTLIEAHQRIAADLNNSNSITIADLKIFNQILLYGKAPNPAWVFVAEEGFSDLGLPYFPTFQDSVQDYYFNLDGNEVNFEVVKKGDVNCTCLWGIPEPQDTLVLFSVGGGSVSKDSIFELSLRTKDFDEIEAYQLGLSFNTDSLDFVEVLSAGLNYAADTSYWGLDSLSAGEIKTIWYHQATGSATGTDTTLVDSTAIFTLKFKALEDIPDISKVLRLDDDVLLNLAFNAMDTVISILLKPEIGIGRSSNEPLQGSLNSVSECYPNPVTDQLTIRLQLAEEADVVINIVDALGKQIAAKKLYLSNGIQLIQFDNIADWSNGLYYYNFKIKDETYNGKFIKASAH